MRLEDAKIALKPLINKRFREIFTPSQMENIIRAKGRSGQLLELALGLQNTNTTLDFIDGELKTNKCDKEGNPQETMYITQISKIIDDLLLKKIFMILMFIKRYQIYFMFPLVRMDHQKIGCFCHTYM